MSNTVYYEMQALLEHELPFRMEFEQVERLIVAAPCSEFQKSALWIDALCRLPRSEQRRVAERALGAAEQMLDGFVPEQDGVLHGA